MIKHRHIPVVRLIARLNIGGPAIHTVLLTKELKPFGFDTTLACGPVDTNEGDMSYIARESGITLTIIPELSRDVTPFKDIVALYKVLRLLFTLNPRILHTHTAKAGTLGRIAGILYNCTHPFSPKIRLVHTFHGHILHGYFPAALSAFFTVIERFLGRCTDQIITVGETVKKDLVALNIAPAEKILVVPLGFDLTRLSEIPALLPPTGKIVVGIVGRLVPIKNHQMFLEAARQLLSTLPQENWEFRVVGNGELHSPLKEHCRVAGIVDSVKFLGWEKDLVTIYHDMDIVALTSLNEGTPVSLIEAMASGKAIVATEVGGVPDLLGSAREIRNDPIGGCFKIAERGILVASHDAQALAAAIAFLVKNPLVRSVLSTRAREFALATFTKERLTSDVKNLYEKLIS